MALVNSWEKQGNFLFKYRGQFPVLLFAMAIPFIYITDISEIDTEIWNSSAILLSVLGFLIRFYTTGTTPKGTSGRNTKQQIADVLNSTGIYSVVRHPLYLGNYLIWIGIVVFVYNIYFIIIVSLIYWLYYERIMFAEERFLERKFTDNYIKWSEDRPAFIPSFKNYVKTKVKFSVKSILRREYAGLLATVIGYVFIDFARNYFVSGNLMVTDEILNVLYVTIVLVFLLRSLKHYTSILDEKDRS